MGFRDGSTSGMNETTNNPLEQLFTLGQFDAAWMKSGLLDNEAVAEVLKTMSFDEDPHPEHWRYRTVTYLIENRDLDPQQLFDLYKLAELHEEDYNASISMRIRIICSSSCPISLIAEAKQSNIDVLQRTAIKILHKRGSATQTYS
jgi:hypothetical protein